MKKITLTLTTLVLLLATNYGQDTTQGKPNYCILFIGDGFGTSAKTAARMALGQGTIGKRFTDDPQFRLLELDRLRFSSTVTTHSANSWITDSGPGSSVYASGEKGKIDNEAVGFNVATGESIETILEAAKKEGYAVGLVTTTRITHATPAAFATHTWFRDLEDYIASQYISSNQTQYKAIYNDSASTTAPYNPARDWQLPAPKVGVEVDVLLGGGFRHFFPNGTVDTIRNKNNKPVLNNGSVVTMAGRRIDNVDLIKYAKKRGYVYVNSRNALLNLDTSLFTHNNDAKLLGLFHSSHLNYEQDRQMSAQWEPSLFEMVEIAIKVLKAKGGKKGFFLMVEGGRIDHLEHANEGGITVVAGSPNNQYTVDADKPVYVGGGEANYTATPTTPRLEGVYGSDYLIKEVLAFDYSVAQARKLLAESNSKTLIFSTSDHECGGTAIVGLHDTSDAQANGTKIRTYARGPRQNGVAASSSGGPTATTYITPTNLARGDIDFGAMNPNGWYPNYSTYTFQGRPELWPKIDSNGRRIVVAFASNPLTNGNGTKAGGTPGNHTPMDIWVGSDDNVNGRFASDITAKGLIDNTYLTHIMADFLNLVYPFSSSSKLSDETSEVITPALRKVVEPGNSLKAYPNPASDVINLDINIPAGSEYKIEFNNISGNTVKTINGNTASALKNLQVSTSSLNNGIYVAKLTIFDKGKITEVNKKIIIQK